jgi:hypothetical protein
MDGSGITRPIRLCQFANKVLAVFLLNDYELREKSTHFLATHLQGDYQTWTPTLFDAMDASIFHSTYLRPGSAPSLSAVIYAVFPIIVSKWTYICEGLGNGVSIVEKAITDLSEGNLSEKMQAKRLKWLREALDREIRPPNFFDTTMGTISSMMRSLEQCEILESRLQY